MKWTVNTTPTKPGLYLFCEFEKKPILVQLIKDIDQWETNRNIEMGLWVEFDDWSNELNDWLARRKSPYQWLGPLPKRLRVREIEPEYRVQLEQIPEKERHELLYGKWDTSQK